MSIQIKKEKNDLYTQPIKDRIEKLGSIIDNRIRIEICVLCIENKKMSHTQLFTEIQKQDIKTNYGSFNHNLKLLLKYGFIEKIFIHREGEKHYSFYKSTPLLENIFPSISKIVKENTSLKWSGPGESLQNNRDSFAEAAEAEEARSN